ncbi:hypothetical protein C2E20_1803 [Micractinium conductrix]|uniref:Uncharacterized protein n=1 Tax=Micractinium conductrix TaxID=554055 RepID=A0A2P6VLU9_9CHLO|nr:hypothetical protein C2E20_1803 [Micractinium conductrix]|eukprot:PSC75063.1 hypothetical protein C2E20_1803 [Micractinium conductrix]
MPATCLRRSRSLGSRSTAQRQTPAAGGAPAGGGLPGPVPKFSSEVTFQPLGHQGSKWCVPAPPPATPASAATVAAVDVLSQSTTAALTRERRQEAPAGAGGDRRQQPPPAWASSVASDPSDGIFHAMPACAASQLPAHRPWTGVRRVIEEACQAAAAPGVSLTSTSALPWDVPAAAVGGVWRRGPSQRTAEGTDPRAGRPPRPPGPPSAALLRPTRAEPSPPYKARVWHAQSTENFSPLFTSAASESLRRRQGEPAAAEATISPPASPPAASSARLAVLRRLLPHRRR